MDRLTQSTGEEQFLRLVASEDACRQFLERVRWPEGFICPKCGAAGGWRTGRGQFRCMSCQAQSSVTAGTALEGTRKPLRQWMRAIWYATGRKSGVSALGLQQELKLHNYETAWRWMHRLRAAMASAGSRLSGTLELDAIRLGGPDDANFRTAWIRPMPVAIAVQRDCNNIGRLAIKILPEVTWPSMHHFVDAIAEPGAVVITHRWRGGRFANRRGYQITAVRPAGDLSHALLPGVAYVATTLRRWLRGTYCGSMQPPHLGDYLDEFTFRANHRKGHGRSELFYLLVAQALRSPADLPKYPAATEGGGSLAPN